MALLNLEERTSRVEHKCYWCDCLIKKGERYERSANTYDGSVFTWKNHIFCRKIAEQLNMWDDVDEGLGEGDFCDIIQEEYAKIMSKEHNDIWESESFVMPDFKGRLIFLLEHYNIPHTL